jgi:hypothetical protein
MVIFSRKTIMFRNPGVIVPAEDTGNPSVMATMFKNNVFIKVKAGTETEVPDWVVDCPNYKWAIQDKTLLVIDQKAMETGADTKDDNASDKKSATGKASKVDKASETGADTKA